MMKSEKKKNEMFLNLRHIFRVMKVMSAFLLISVMSVLASKSNLQVEALNLNSKDKSTVVIINDVAEVEQIAVSGTVTDDTGEPLPGVSVIIKGTSRGTTTNIDGLYTLSNVPENATLVFSFVGMKSQEIQVVGQLNINVTLVSDALGIDEVVVTALGIKRERKALGYSVSSMSAEEISKTGQTNVINSLQGKVAGLNISKGSGLSDESASIVLRGNSSITGNNNALIVVDGVIYNNPTFGDNLIDRGQGISDIINLTSIYRYL